MPPEDEVAVALRGVRALMGVVALSLGQAFEQVSPPQLRVLVLLRAVGRLQVGELGGVLGLSPSGATRAAARMERDGWLRRVRVEGDRRAVALESTAKGDALVAAVLRARERELGAALGAMRPGDRAAALHGLTVLADALQEPADEGALQTLGFPPEGAGRAD